MIGKEYERLVALHPTYKYGWKSSFLDEHRMINWVVFYILKTIKENSSKEVFQNKITLPNNFNFPGTSLSNPFNV